MSESTIRSAAQRGKQTVYKDQMTVGPPYPLLLYHIKPAKVIILMTVWGLLLFSVAAIILLIRHPGNF